MMKKLKEFFGGEYDEDKRTVLVFTLAVIMSAGLFASIGYSLGQAEQAKTGVKPATAEQIETDATSVAKEQVETETTPDTAEQSTSPAEELDLAKYFVDERFYTEAEEWTSQEMEEKMHFYDFDTMLHQVYGRDAMVEYSIYEFTATDDYTVYRLEFMTDAYLVEVHTHVSSGFVAPFYSVIDVFDDKNQKSYRTREHRGVNSAERVVTNLSIQGEEQPTHLFMMERWTFQELLALIRSGNLTTMTKGGDPFIGTGVIHDEK